jgi:hypothetical protein
MVTPYNDVIEDHLGQKCMAYCNNNSINSAYTHYLLDGQQRANAIALGFIDPLSENKHLSENNHSALLWVDLEASTSKYNDREFIFRVLNKYNPWGFKKNDSEQLSRNQIRKAFESFKEALLTENYKDFTPAKFPLKYAWPWDASAPIPVNFLWYGNKEKLLKCLENLDFWNSKSFQSQREKIQSAIHESDSVLSDRLDIILSKFSMLSNYIIPTLEVDISKDSDSMDNSNPKETSEKPDHVETLFVRVNSQGTALEGEELIYSILKSEWHKAPKYIENVKHHLFTPPRMVIAAARLILSRNQKENKEQPPIPDVSRFRKLMRDIDKDVDGFSGKLRDYFENNSNSLNGTMNVFEVAHRLLSLDSIENLNNKDDYRLHPLLVTDLSRGPSGHDVILLLLRWIDRLLEEDIDPLTFDDDTQKNVLGFITAISWFSVDAKKCIRRIWNDLQNMDGEGLKSFFSCDRFKKIIENVEGEGIVLIPPLTPKKFEKSINDITNKNIENIVSNDGEFTFYGHFIQEFSYTDYTLWNDLNDNMNNDNIGAKWINNLWWSKNFVIYSQSYWLMKWFPDFDPTIPGATNINRPWDYDHIHPSWHVNGRHNIPEYIKKLHRSIGNIRAWPMEANRSDGKNTPEDKLKNSLTEQEQQYGYGLNKNNVAEASFIDEKSELKLFIESTPDPKEKPFYRNYLSINHKGKYKEEQEALIYAITNRLCRLYKYWFDTLKIHELLSIDEES